MFKYDSFRKLDYWGAGVEVSVQYDWADADQTTKRPTGIAFILSLATREFRFGYFWG